MAKNLREFTPDKILIQKNKGNGKNILNNSIHKLLSWQTPDTEHIQCKILIFHNGNYSRFHHNVKSCYDYEYGHYGWFL